MTRPLSDLAKILCAAVLLGALGIADKPAQAAAGPWLDHEQAQVRLISAQDAAGVGDELRLGLQFKLSPGWKIYWRTPGAAGFPPSIEWSDGSGVAETRMDWPVPKRFSLFGLETFGYSDEVVLPVTVRRNSAEGPARLEGQLNYLVCEEICIPHTGVITLNLPAGPAQPAMQAFLIDEADALVPRNGSLVGLSVDRAVLGGSLDKPALRVTARSDGPFMSPDLLVEGPQGYGFGKPEVTLSDDRQQARLVVPISRSSIAEGVIEGKRLTLTITDGQRGMEQEIVAQFATLPAVSDGVSLSLIAAMGLALIGGLILNLMPCVLPVLSIKLLKVVNQGGRAPGAVRASFLATAAGILSTFWVLAAVVVALKATGMAIGWGIQFQQPLFLSAMALIVTLFACNLFGWFEVPLPRLFARMAEARPAEEDPKLGGSFGAGILATLLATPCTAPYLGTAVGFALARGPLDILLVFTALGIGLAIPYVLVAVFPGLATRLPKPGPWMIHLRRILGLALVATAIWLVTVLGAQVGSVTALSVTVLLTMAAVLLWLRRRWHQGGPALAGVSVLALAVLLVPFLLPASATNANLAARHNWVPFDQAAIVEYVEDGKTVFVDITAEWCITCKANATLVLDKGEVAERLADDNVVRMRGDWTLPDQTITDYLTSRGRYGVPFDAVYGPGAPAGVLLPELLTQSSVIEALNQADGG